MKEFSVPIPPILPSMKIVLDDEDVCTAVRMSANTLYIRAVGPGYASSALLTPKTLVFQRTYDNDCVNTKFREPGAAKNTQCVFFHRDAAVGTEFLNWVTQLQDWTRSQ